MIGVAVYFFIALDSKLYAELPLQVFYFGISLYGWHQWQFGGKGGKELPVTQTPLQQGMVLFGLVAAGSLLVGFLLNTYTDTDVPYWDAFTTTASLVGTWMQARKKLENWLVWLVVDSVYVGLFFYKGYYLISLLNLIYLGFALYGWWNWWRSMQADTAKHTTS